MALESRNAGIDFRLLLHTVPFGGERQKNEMAQTGRIYGTLKTNMIRAKVWERETF